MPPTPVEGIPHNIDKQETYACCFGNTANSASKREDFRDRSYYRARYYDPSNGRFLIEDPAEFGMRTALYPHASDTNRWWANRLGRPSSPYSYAANDPVLLRDPLGLAPYGYQDCIEHCRNRYLEETAICALSAFLDGPGSAICEAAVTGEFADCLNECKKQYPCQNTPAPGPPSPAPNPKGKS
jgi:RHS repeat-associated protein